MPQASGQTDFPAVAWCLTHQRAEDQATPLGLVCPECKRRLYLAPPSGSCRAYWEGQPGARTLAGDPCWVYTLQWDDFRIRTLHASEAETDPRGLLASLLTTPSST